MKKILLTSFLLTGLLTSQAQISGLVCDYNFNAANNLDGITPKANGPVTFVSYTQDRFTNPGAAASFGGASFINLGSPSKAQFTTGLTISAWFKVSGVSGLQAIVSKWAGNINSDQYIVMVNGNKITMAVGNTSNSALGVTGNIIVTPNVWHHVIATWDNTGTHEIHLDGVLDVSVVNTNFTTINSSAATVLAIGNQSGGTRQLIGSVDDVKLFNRKINATEIGQLYNEANWCVGGLVSKYSFDNSTALDEVNNNDPILTSCLTATDRFGNPSNAIAIDPLNSYINFNDSYDGFSAGATGKATYSFWTKFNSTTPSLQMLLCKYTDSGCPGGSRSFLLRQNSNGKLLLNIFGDLNGANNNILEGSTAVNDATWHHIVLTYDGALSSTSKFNIFVDGVAETISVTGTTGAGIGAGYIDGPAPLSVGSYLQANGTICFNGQRLDASFDDFFVYNKVLNQTEITDLYNGVVTTINTNEKSNSPIVSVFPNPFSNTFKIVIDKNDQQEITVFSVDGQLIHNETSNTIETSINTSMWADGLYFVTIKTKNGTKTQKIIKQ